MPETEHNAQDVIAGYRRRRERMVPLILGGMAVIMLAAGIVLGVMWLTGSNPPALPSLFATDTLTPTVTLIPPTITPSVTPTPPPTETPTPIGPRTYLVQLGDSLWSIAAEFDVDILLLMSVNNITNPDEIFVGQELTIPAPGTERPTPTSLPETLMPGTRIEYIVEPGDTLVSIAAKFNSTAEAIAQASGIKVTDVIGPGQKLLVPVGIATPTPTLQARPATPTSTPTP